MKWANFLKGTLPDLTQEKDHPNRRITIKDIKWVINNLPKQEAAGPDKLTDEFFRKNSEHLRKELYQFHNLFQKLEAEKNIS